MQDKNKVLLLLSLLLMLCAKLPLAAQAATVSGAELLVIPDCTNQTLILRFTADKVPLAVKTNNIRNEARADSAIGWSIAWQAPQPSLPAIKEYQTMGTVSGACPAPGRYAVPLSVVFDALGTQENLNIHVDRATEPVLGLPTSVTLRSELAVPIWADIPKVPSILLTETSSLAAIKGISASGGQLKNASGEMVDTVLKPNFSVNDKTIKAGGEEDLQLSVSTTPDVGTYTTRLTVHSPSLKQSQPIDVTFKVTVSSLWLLGTILVGILIGWWVNTRLARQAALDTARLEAFRSADGLRRRAALQTDPAVQQRFLALLAALESDIHAARTPAEVQGAVTKSSSGADAIEQEAGKSAQDLRLALARVRDKLEPGRIAPDDMVRQKLEALTGQLGDIDAAAAAGDVFDAQRRLDEFEATLQPSITSVLQPWLMKLHEDLSDLGKWSTPAQALEQERLNILALITSAYQVVGGPVVSDCDKIAATVRTLMVFTGPRAIAEAFRSAAGALQAAKPALALALSALATELLGHTALGASPLDTLRRLITARRDAEALLQLEKPSDTALIRCLEIGDFPGAAAAILPPGTVPATAPVQLPAPIARTASDALAPGAVANPIPRILVPALLSLRSPSILNLDWAGSAPTGNVAWTCSPPENAVIAKGNSLSAEITPSKAGFITVSVNSALGTVVTAQTYAGNMTETTGFIQLAKDSAKVNHTVWFITAVLTSITGYLIFANAWIGSLSDFFSAFVWGFFGQFGLDRIRDAVKTTTARTLP